MLRFTKNISRWLRRQARIKTTINELSVLNDRDLSDIGISRCDIHRVAHHMVERTL